MDSPSFVDRSRPLFPSSLASAINDGYEIAFVGIVEFLERSLAEAAAAASANANAVKVTPHHAPSTTISSSSSSAGGPYYAPEQGEPRGCDTFGDGVGGDFSAAALRRLVTATRTTPIAMVGGGTPCRIVTDPSDPALSPTSSTRGHASPSSFPASPSPSPPPATFSAGHLGISFNAGKDSIAMLHLALNAMERLVEVGDWVCARYSRKDSTQSIKGGRSSSLPAASLTLVRPRHMALFQRWRPVLAGGPADEEEEGGHCGPAGSPQPLPPLRRGKGGFPAPSPCERPVLSFLLSHLCIFYFEDRDEIPEMRFFFRALLRGLDLPVFAMGVDGGLRLKEEECDEDHWDGAAAGGGASEANKKGCQHGDPSHISIAAASFHSHSHSHATAGSKHMHRSAAGSAMMSRSGLGASTVGGGCGRLHSRRHHPTCPLLHCVPSAEGSPVAGRRCAPDFGALTQSRSIVKGSEMEEDAAFHSPLAVPRDFMKREEEKGHEIEGPQQHLYYGAKVVCVAEGAGMVAGLGLLRRTLGVRFAFLGVRCEDIVGWRQDPIEMTSAGWPTLLRLCPIFSWSYPQVWTYLFDSGAPFCNLYAMGVTSCGPSARTVRNPDCCLALPAAAERRNVPFSANDEASVQDCDDGGAHYWRLSALRAAQPDNWFDAARHSVHPNAPAANTTISSSADGSSGAAVGTDNMWPFDAVNNCTSTAVEEGGALLDGRHLFMPHAEQRKAEADATANASAAHGDCVLAAWGRWWAERTGGGDREGGGGAVPMPLQQRPKLDCGDVVTAAWDPREVDLNAGHLFHYISGPTLSPLPQLLRNGGVSVLTRGSAYDPSAFAAVAAAVESTVGAARFFPRDEGDEGRIVYAAPAWLLREGSLERRSRLPAPKR